MKKFFILSLGIFLSTALLAQKGKEKKKDKQPATTEQKTAREVILGRDKSPSGSKESAIWEGTRDRDGGGPKPSKNQPAKVRAAFAHDYPNASNVRWSKYRGDWTATFRHGLLTSTAVYHANGQRRDTRTLIPRSEAPRPVLDEILKRRPATILADIIKIEVPQVLRDIFRIKTTDGGTTRYFFFNAEGKEVKYNY